MITTKTKKVLFTFCFIANNTLAHIHNRNFAIERFQIVKTISMFDEDDHDLIYVSSSSSPLQSTSSKSSKKRSLENDSNQSKIITSLLKNNNDEYKIIKNTRNVSSDIWLKFGFPAKKNVEHPDRYDIIPNYSSCFKCFRTYRFTDSTTSSMKDHKCPQEYFQGLKTLEVFSASSSPSSSARISTASSSSTPYLSPTSSRSVFITKVVKKKKENLKKIFVRWVVTGMRPFQIVKDLGLEDIIQECLDIGMIEVFYLF